MEEQKIELRSEDVQEILGTPPSWIVSWGTVWLMAVVAFLGLAGWFIHYPDVIDARVVLTTSVPPVEVVARAEGNISKLLITDNQQVKQGEVLVVLQSTSNYEDILKLDNHVSTWQRAGIDSFQNIQPPRGLELGDLQSDYSVFIQNLENLQFGKTEKSASARENRGSIGAQIETLKKSIRLDEAEIERAKNQVKSANDIYERYRKLYSDQLISLIELEQKNRDLDAAKNHAEALEGAVLRKRNDIISLQKSIGDISFSEKEDVTTVSVRVNSSLSALRSSIDKWKQTYLLTAPINGTASLNSAVFAAYQYVKVGEQVMTIVPPESDKIIGRVNLPVAGSGKVKKEQKVILRLDSYPYYEFGTLEGRVESKALVPKDNQYSIQISLPKGLKTSYGRDIAFEQQLQGSAQIITEDKRLLERIWEQIFARANAYK